MIIFDIRTPLIFHNFLSPTFHFFQCSTMTTYFVNVNEEVRWCKKTNVTYDYTKIWSPTTPGSGYNKINDMVVGDIVVQYTCKKMMITYVTETAIPESRPSCSLERHGTEGFLVRVEPYFENAKFSRISPSVDDIICNLPNLAPNSMKYFDSSPFSTRVPQKGRVYSCVTLTGYIWELGLEMEEIVDMVC